MWKPNFHKPPSFNDKLFSVAKKQVTNKSVYGVDFVLASTWRLTFVLQIIYKLLNPLLSMTTSQ